MFATKKIYRFIGIIFLQLLIVEIILTVVLWHRYKYEHPVIKNYSNSFAIEFATLRLMDAIANEREETKIWKVVSDIPDWVIDDLKSIGGGVENAGNPTKVSRELGKLTISDNLLTFKLRPSTKLQLYALPSRNLKNLNPPQIFFPSGAFLTKDLKRWLKENALYEYQYTVNREGNRLTLPAIESNRKIVIVGDSVAFGIGVDDKHTSSSALQKLIGDTYQVINLGVGSYQADQIYNVARFSRHKSQETTLIYIACQNDFWGEHGFDVEEFKKVSGKFAALKGSGDYKDLIIILTPYVQFSHRKLLGDWPQSVLHVVNEGFKTQIPEIGRNYNYTSINLYHEIEKLKIEQKTPFAGLELFHDQGHFSAKGNEFIAQLIFEHIE